MPGTQSVLSEIAVIIIIISVTVLVSFQCLTLNTRLGIQQALDTC